MRVLIFGGNGMLGHKLCQRLSLRMDTFATVRESKKEYAHFNFISENKIIGGIDVLEINQVQKVLGDIVPQVVTGWSYER